MSRTADQCLAELQALLPPGQALPRELEAVFTRLLAALADENARLYDRAAALIGESDPRYTLELLADWERVLGLPDPCSGDDQTIQERRGSVVAKLLYEGGLSRQFFIDLAAALGYGIEIVEYSPFVCGISQCGVDQLNPAEMRFVWRARLSEPRTTYFRCGESELGTDPLLKIDRADDLECLFKRRKPAHTTVFVDYTGA
ncbi:YmfQ family protein [Alkalilimnicola sp. S0819]|uniref:YmfQ family protein n=1 Tax=Alkalilimnicola sp. S0819 TaxID=2613922 RepID=UPI0012627DC9|nr:putative phage tail protein [Alkalilimnicola sp. S0819]KAB7624312.1 DUF2313 domain-containing protein [Alkalilimnicola sp. S0819]MPQ16136.1 DUF2313 domain-containing protein [Alkalilimnicola sp. S0819]